MLETIVDEPKFSAIKIDQVENELSQIIADNLSNIDSLLEQKNPFTWKNLIQTIENQDDRLHNMWSPFNHLHAVVNSDSLRKTYQACLPKLSEYGTKLHHNQKLFRAISSIAEGPDFNTLDIAQQKVIHNEIRDFKLAGVSLDAEKKERYAVISKELAQLCSKFEENVLDATQGWTKHVTDESELQGLPPHAAQSAAKAAQQRNLSGWVFSLEAPSYIAVMKYADSAKLREEMAIAYSTRASDQGPTAGKWDNTETMYAILQHRREVAQLLGFNSFSELSLATKMAKTPDQVLEFLHTLAKASLAKAREEYRELQSFAAQKYGIKELNSWDISYYSEKLRKERYDLSQEDLRPYFPEDKVLSGLFTVVKKLFNIDVREVSEADIWHPDVRVFRLYNPDGQIISQFYLDLYARENKRGGAWMDDCHSRRRLQNNAIQAPIAFITCNFDSPINNAPALFTHDDVVTLFHEFGHGLQHMLTQIDYPPVAGINGVPWDAVEIASQFLENWAWDKESLQFIAGHYQTHQPLPLELLEKMHKAKNFQSALQMMRQLEFALFDFRLHTEFDPNKPNQVQTILDEVRSIVSVIPVSKTNRFQNSFSHIFAGGYAAGYYSYKWAEVMAADAFSLFHEKGIFDRATSQKFLSTFLQSGGAKDPADLFIEFRGRPPRVDALLEQDGIK